MGVRDPHKGGIYRSRKANKTTSSKSSTKKRKVLAVTRPTEDGGTITINYKGQVTERNKGGTKTRSYNIDKTKAGQIVRTESTKIRREAEAGKPLYGTQARLKKENLRKHQEKTAERIATGVYTSKRERQIERDEKEFMAYQREKQIYESEEFKEVVARQERAKEKEEYDDWRKGWKGIKEGKPMPAYVWKKPVYYVQDKIKDFKEKYPKQAEKIKQTYNRAETELKGLIPFTAKGEKAREDYIEAKAQKQIQRIKDRPQPEGYYKEWLEKNKLPSTRRQQIGKVREVAEFSKGFSTGLTKPIREKPLKYVAIGGASYVVGGYVAPALKYGGLKTITTLPVHRSMPVAFKVASTGTKAGLVGLYSYGKIKQFEGAKGDPYKAGSLVADTGLEVGSIYAGGKLGQRYSLAGRLQRENAILESQVQALERKDLFNLMKKTSDIPRQTHGLHAKTGKFSAEKIFNLKGKKGLALEKELRGRTTWGSATQKMWNKAKWYEVGGKRIMKAGKVVGYKGMPRQVKDIDATLRWYESKAGFQKSLKAKTGIQADPHPYLEFKMRSIGGVSKRPVTVKIASGGKMKIITAGEQTFRKYIGATTVRDGSYYRFGKDILDLKAGGETLAQHGYGRYFKKPLNPISKAKVMKSVKAIETFKPMAKPTSAYWIGKKPKVNFDDFATTTSYINNVNFVPSVSSYKSYGARTPPKYSFSKSPVSPSFSSSVSPSVSSLSPSISPSLSPSASPSISYSPSPSSPSPPYSPSPSLSPSPSPSLSPSPSPYVSPSPSVPPTLTTTPFLFRSNKGYKKVTKFRKPKQKTRYTKTLFTTVKNIKIKKPKTKKITGLEIR